MAALVSGTLARSGRQHIIAPAVSVVCVNRRHQSSSNLATYKRGKGGRSSFSGTVATVFGSSGFLGRYIVNKLGKTGSQIICPYRGDPYFMKDLKLAGDLGQVLFFPYNLQDEESIRKVMKYSSVVINLVGRDWETKNYPYKRVHVDGARTIARLAKETGVEKLVHFSSLNASDTPQGIYMKEGSNFLKTKYAGEIAVRDEFPDAIIFRPADMYGPEDRFLRYYANPWRRAHGTMPLWKKGTQTIKMPVFCSDVAQGVINALQDPDAVGKTFEAVGPHSYYLSDLVDFFYQCMRWKNFKRSYLTPVFKLKVMYMSMAPSSPIMTMEKIEKDHVTDVLTGCPTLEDLAVKLTRIEDRAPFELKPFRKYSYYEEKLGEFADPEPPPIIS